MISPSNLTRRLLCPGSESAESGYTNSTSPAAAEGTRKHAVMEAWVNSVKAVPAAKLQLYLEGKNTPWWPIGLVAKGDEDCFWAAQQLFPDIAGAVIAGLENDCAVMPEENLSRELFQALGMNKTGDPERCRADLLVLHGTDEATIYDYKFGQDLEDPATDPQMISYAIGVNERFSFGLINMVKVNGMHRKVISGTLTSAHLEHYKSAFATGVADAEKDDAPRVAGKNQCQYCRAKSDCVEAKQYAASLSDHEALVAPAKMKPVKSLADFTALDPITRGAFMAALDESIVQFKELREGIEVWAIEEENQRGGPDIQGYEIGKGRGGRVWRNEIEAASSLALLAKENKKPEEAIYEPKTLLSPAGAEKVFTGVEAKIHIASLVVPLVAKQKLVRVK